MAPSKRFFILLAAYLIALLLGGRAVRSLALDPGTDPLHVAHVVEVAVVDDRLVGRVDLGAAASAQRHDADQRQCDDQVPGQ